MLKLLLCLWMISISAFVPLSAVATDKTLDPTASSEEKTQTHHHQLGCDLQNAGRQAGLGFVKQFTEVDSLALIMGTVATTFVLTLKEAPLQQAIEDAAVLGPTGQKVGDITGLVLNFGLAPIAAYTVGRIRKDEKAIHFAIELAATQAIALVETFFVSQIPIHKRPVIERGEMEEEAGNFFNDALRGQSSFPSGHMVGISALMFTSWNWYGWKLGLPTTLATLFIGWARVEEGQHYVTDIFGTIALTGIASLAVTRTRDLWARIAAGKNKTAHIMAFPMFAGNQGQLIIAGQF